MTSQEPRDEPPRRPRGGDADPPGSGEQDRGPRAVGPPVDPYAPSAPPESRPEGPAAPGQPPPDGQPADGQPAQGQPAQGQPAQGQPAQGQPSDSPPQPPPDAYEGVPYHPDPFDAEPYLGESPTRRDRIRTEQMRRNAEYHEAQRKEAPPYRAEAIGRFKWEAPVQTMPTDPIWPFISRVKRSRRSDWPVLVFALVVAAIVTMGCCLAGFAAFSAWNPFGG